jgi:hypothetical protein
MTVDCHDVPLQAQPMGNWESIQLEHGCDTRAKYGRDTHALTH